MNDDPLSDRERWEPLRQKMEASEVGGLNWAVSVGDDITTGAAGWLDPRTRSHPMPADGLFRIASVTKPIAAVAALQLVDEGLVGLDDPIDDVIPELRNRLVLVEADGPLDQPTVPANRALTLRDLLSFRCGWGMEFSNFEQPLLQRLWELGVGPGPTGPDCSADEFLARLRDLPISDQPATRWRYHLGSDIAGVFVERVRGETLDVVLERDVFAPLGMRDTAFQVRADQVDRFGVCRMNDESGELAIWDEPLGRWASPPKMRSGAAGLLSTTADLVTFGRMMLGGGIGPNGRVLSDAMFREMTTDQLTTEQRVAAQIDGAGPGLGWGLGLAVRSELADGPFPTVGSFGWDGGLGSRWLVDPSHDLVAVLLCTDSFESPLAPALMTDFVDVIAAQI